jgi:hypothetical protein
MSDRSTSPSDPVVQAATAAFGFPAGYWSAGFVWPHPTWSDYPDMIRGLLAAPAFTDRPTPPPLLYADEALYPDCGAVGALWHQARHAPVSASAIRAAVAQDMAPDGPLARRSASDGDALAALLLDAGFFVGWPLILDPRWTLDTLYVVPGSRPGGPFWPLVRPGLPTLPLSLHHGALVARSQLSLSAWRALHADMLCALTVSVQHARAVMAAWPLPPPPTLPLVFTRRAWLQGLEAAGVALPDLAPTPPPAVTAAAQLLEARLPRLLGRGATLLATTATGLETPA